MLQAHPKTTATGPFDTRWFAQERAIARQSTDIKQIFCRTLTRAKSRIQYLEPISSSLVGDASQCVTKISQTDQLQLDRKENIDLLAVAEYLRLTCQEGGGVKSGGETKTGLLMTNPGRGIHISRWKFTRQCTHCGAGWKFPHCRLTDAV